MGTQDGSCKGFYLTNERRKSIAINSDLAELIQRIILAHELGHAVLHSQQPAKAFHDCAFMDQTNRTEYEANIFAAEFLLDDKEVLDTLRTENDFFRAASILNVPPELLDFKLQLLQREGHRIQAPCMAKSKFLKRNIARPLV